MKRLGTVVVILLAALLGRGSRLTAQAPPTDETLDRIEAAIDSGRVATARTELERWFAGRGSDANRAAMSRARFLRARLSRDADSARNEYLWIAIDGGSRYGAAAWLKLAQLDLVRGEPERARQDLERLRADYPRSELVPDSWYWTGVASASLGDLAAACSAWQRGENEAAARGDLDLTRRSGDAAEACVEGELRFTVQVGAFRDAGTAQLLMKQATDLGFSARVVPSDGLHKVRVGTFGSVESAREAASRLEASGFATVVVADQGERS